MGDRPADLTQSPQQDPFPHLHLELPAHSKKNDCFYILYTCWNMLYTTKTLKLPTQLFRSFCIENVRHFNSSKSNLACTQ